MIELHHTTRRRLLTAMALSPLLWRMNTASAAVVDPQRIVALEWLPVELLLALGITPYGIADIPNYKLWVSEPPLPDSVIDVGLRTGTQSRTADRNETLVSALVGRLWSFPGKAGAYCAWPGI
ncbi:ferrichrome-binding periplasmic protein [Citrobacter freundii]|nr:ferrichrome-binding periplasmic protein [Citrobacter freundii]